MMNTRRRIALLGIPVALSLSAAAAGLREDEADVVTVLQRAEADQSLDLRPRWYVRTLAETGLSYSAVGWDLTPQAAGATVRLNLQDGIFADGAFRTGAYFNDLAKGLTGTGTFAWTPNGIEKKVYRILHDVTRNDESVESEMLTAYFDFTGCAQAREPESPEFRGAVLGVSQPVACTDDTGHPWTRIGGDGDGLRNEANGATLAFSFTGLGTFAAELLVSAGTVTVALDGVTVATVSAGASWTGHAWPVADFGAHVLTLTYDGDVGVSVRGCSFAQDMRTEVADGDSGALAALDLREAFPVAKLESEPALENLAYSAVGWDPDPADDPSRTVTVTARSGTFADGVFMPDAGAEMTVLAATTGRGTFDWHPSGISKKLYQLVHTVRKNGAVDETGTLYGYMDFTQCAIWASQADVEAAVLGAFTHEIAVEQDAANPWQPIDTVQVRSGIVTDEMLPAETETATTFTFRGRGVLHYEYDLTGGQLAVVADGETASTFTEPTADWTPCTVTFTGYGEHEAAFVYTADGYGGALAIRNVRWEETDAGDPVQAVSSDFRADLQQGVRTPKYMSQILPFEYSSTNWIGDVSGVTAASVAKVAVVQLEGSDPVVTNWTTEVAGTYKVLKETAGEGSVVWKGQKGVWKATFEILTDSTAKKTEYAWFDLRNAKGPGLILIFK